MAGRSEKQLIGDGGQWVRARREELGWSQAKLAIRAGLMRLCQRGLRGPEPTAADIASFENGEVRQLPRWLTLVEDVFAFTEVEPEHRQAWLARRNWYSAGHPVDLAEVLVHRDEYRLLETLGGMREADRRAWRAFLTAWRARGDREKDRVAAAEELLRRLGVDLDVLTSEERQLVDATRRASGARRAALVGAVLEAASWPEISAFAAEGAERALLDGFRLADEDGRLLLTTLGSDEGMRRAVIEMLVASQASQDAERGK